MELLGVCVRAQACGCEHAQPQLRASGAGHLFPIMLKSAGPCQEDVRHYIATEVAVPLEGSNYLAVHLHPAGEARSEGARVH